MDKILEAKKVFDTEILALEKTRDALDDAFIQILDTITSCKGKVVITGMGKPGHIASKIAATMASLGTPAFCLHPAEALHGDLGMITSDDVVIAISYSGESDEITRMLPNIKMIGATLIAISGNPESTLVKNSDMAQIFPKFDEACYLGLAPTSSTTAALVYGDALAVVASGIYGFQDADFGRFHPAGALGKKLVLRTSDVMIDRESTAVIGPDASLQDAIVAMSRRGMTMVTVLDGDTLLGILTDGDLRRLLEHQADIYHMMIQDAMTRKPTIIRDSTMAIEALKLLQDRNFTAAPVLDDEDHYVGVVTIHSVMAAGIVLPRVEE